MNVFNKFIQRRLNEAREQGLKEGKSIGYDVGFEKGEKQGLATGTKQTNVVVDLFNQLVNNMEKELTELRLLVANKESKSNTKQEFNNKITKSEKELIEEHIFYFGLYSEIADSNFFNHFLYQQSTSESIKELITYIDYLEHSIEVKNTYPKTYKELPKLRMAYEKLYENKLVTEEAEKLL